MSLLFPRALYVFFLLMFSALSYLTEAQVLLLPAKVKGMDLSKQVVYVHSDLDSPLSLLNSSPNFRPFESRHFTFKAKKTWYKLNLRSTQASAGIWYIDTEIPNIAVLKAYLDDGKSDWRLIYDDSRHFKARDNGHGLINLPLELKPLRDYTLLIEVRGPANVPLGFKLYDPTSLNDYNNKFTLFNGILLGFCLLICLLSFCYLLFQFDGKSAALFVFSTSVVLYVSETSGFNFKFLWPEQPNLNSYSPPVIISFTYASYLYFISKVCALKTVAPRLNRSFQALIICTFIGLNPFFDLVQASMVLMVLTCPIPVISIWWVYRRGDPSALFLLIGSFTNISFNALSALIAISAIKLPLIHAFTLSKLGFVFELFAFAVALLYQAWLSQQTLIRLTEQKLSDNKMLYELNKSKELAVLAQKEAQLKRRQSEERTRLMNDLVEKKKQLLADISHELRTPLTVLQLQIEALEANLEEDLGLAYRALSAKVTDMDNFISDLYFLAKSDIGALKLNISRLDIVDCFQEWQHECKFRVEGEGLTWSFASQALSSVFVAADEDKLKQVIQNLLTNAIAYTDSPGSIKLSIHLKGEQLEIALEDSYPSVDASELAHIFERLYRAESSRSRQTGGSGLGLSICKSVIEAHNGLIVAEPSTLGGIKIRILLPVEPLVSE